MITRDEAHSLLLAQNPDTSLLHHSLETEAVMRGLAARLGEDEDLWGVTGLLHDLDFPHTKEDPSRHGIMVQDMLAGKLPDEALAAIKAHNSEYTGREPSSRFDFALRAAESVTGLVSANALVRPTGMEGMKPKSLKKKMKDKSFAANVRREEIMECSELGLELGEFFTIAIQSITTVADQVGLASS